MLDMKNDIEDNLTKRPVLISYHENQKITNRKPISVNFFYANT